MLTDQKLALLMDGLVIPAHPLALDASRKLDEPRQRLLTQYYLATGAGGVAVGVHTTQFAIRDPKHGLFEPVLALAAEEVEKSGKEEQILKIAGVSGPTAQAAKEAEIAVKLGYDMVLLSTNGLGTWSEGDLIERAKEVGKVIPLFGFYLQPAVGGRVLSRKFWQAFAAIPSVKAIKIAPFNRYQTIDVIRAVCLSERRDEIALYTGNDDNIVLDLLTPYRVQAGDETIVKYIAGGLLGHWAVWTRRAVQLLEDIKVQRTSGEAISPRWLTRAIAVTDSNAALFDAANQFRGCIAGLHEVLQRQGLMEGTWCLDPEEGLSPGQKAEIDRIYLEYPELADDEFVKDFLARLSLGDSSSL